MAKKKETQVEEKAEVAEQTPKAAKSKKVTKQEALDLSKVDAKAVEQMRQEYFQHRLNVMLGKESDTAKLKTMRKNIARALMHLHINKQK